MNTGPSGGFSHSQLGLLEHMLQRQRPGLDLPYQDSYGSEHNRNPGHHSHAGFSNPPPLPQYHNRQNPPGLQTPDTEVQQPRQLEWVPSQPTHSQNLQPQHQPQPLHEIPDLRQHHRQLFLPNPAGRLAPQQQHNQQPQQHQQHQRPPNDNYSDQQEQSRLVDALRVQQQQPLPQQQPEELMSREYLARLLHEQRSELEALRRQRDADDARTAPQTGPTPDKHPSATAPPRRTKPRQPPAAAGGAAIGLPSTSAGSAFGQPQSSSASSGPTVGNGSIPGAAPARRPTVGNGSITGAAPARGPSSSGPETETATAAIAAVTPTVDADSDPPPPQSLSAVMRDINAAHAPHTETDPTLRALWIQDLIVHQIGLMAKDFGMPEAQCRRMVVPGSGCIDIRKPNDANL